MLMLGTSIANAAFIDTSKFTSAFMSLNIGQKDDRGTEIYEGDILKGRFYGFINPIDDYTFRVYWDEVHTSFMADYFEPAMCEVIGNIYENPELLED